MTNSTGRSICFKTCAVIALTIILLTWPENSRAATPKKIVQVSDDFPVYAQIKPNVTFWIDIFTQYSRADGVIHDVRDLSKIYTVIKLDPDNTRKAAKANRRIKEKALKRYKAILLKLAKGKIPKTPEERNVARLFGPA